MAVFQTYTAVGNNEDLSNIVTRVAVEETPLLSSIKKTKATGVKHEWVNETLDAPVFNAEVEGSDAVYGVITPRTRTDNQCQIVRKTGLISRTQEAVMKAGISSEYSHQLEKKTKELARDMERVLWQGSKSAGSATVARTSEGIFSFLATNRQNMATTLVTGTAQAGAASTITLAVGGGAGTAAGDRFLITAGTGAGQVRTQVGAAAGDVVTVSEAWDVVPDVTSVYSHYGVPLALSEVVLNNGIQASRDAGGQAKSVYVDGKQKRAISGFAQGIRRVGESSKTLVNSVDMYDSDFGQLQIKYDRWTPAGCAAILDEEYFATAFLRPVIAEEMPTTGSAKKFMIEGEFCLESTGESASAIVMGAL